MILDDSIDTDGPYNKNSLGLNYFRRGGHPTKVWGAIVMMNTRGQTMANITGSLIDDMWVLEH